MRILLAPTADLARETLEQGFVSLTVEAEYGSFVAEGQVYTAAHHQPSGQYAGRHLPGGVMPSPCNDKNIPWLGEGGTILISHLDLDTVGGCLRAAPEFRDLFDPWHQGFWDLAEFVDVNGIHKIGLSGASQTLQNMLYAYRAASEIFRYPKDSVSDATESIRRLGEILRGVLNKDQSLMRRGEELRNAEYDLNNRTYGSRNGEVISRTTMGPFCNHLYVDPAGRPAKAIVAWNYTNGSITLSLADPIPGVSCCEIVQALWGKEAGGHAGIAGSPRGQVMGLAAFHAAFHALSERISQCS